MLKTDTNVKLCSRCGQVKALDFFSVNGRYVSGRQSYCKSCVAQYRIDNKNLIERQIKGAKQRNPDKYRDQWLRKQYGISLEKYLEMEALQNGVCYLCGGVSPSRGGKQLMLSVDHDHRCCPGKKSCGNCVRKLLCANCNFGIGSLKDNPALLRAAAEYLEEEEII